MTSVRFWLRSLAVGAAAGLVIGFVVGGTLGRIFMRLLFLAREDTLGLETSMGGIIGDLTAGGTVFIAFFGGLFGVLLGIGYVLFRRLLPHRLAWREAAFTLAATGLMLGFVVRANRDDFDLLPVTLSLLLIVASVAATAAPVPVLVERFAPDRAHTPGKPARAALTIGGVAIAVFAVTAVASVYSF